MQNGDCYLLIINLVERQVSNLYAGYVLMKEKWMKKLENWNTLNPFNNSFIVPLETFTLNINYMTVGH